MNQNNNKDNVENNHNLKSSKMSLSELIASIEKDHYKIDNSFSLTETRVRGIGSNIAFYRAQNGLSQEKLAELLRVDRTTISNWENSKSCPDGWQIEDMAKLFKVDITELYSKKVYTVNSKQTSHPVEEKREREWLENHPDDFLNRKMREGEVFFCANDLMRDYVYIDRVDLIVIALELIERGFCVTSCCIDYSDGELFNGVGVFLKKGELESFKNAMSEIIISFATKTSRFQSVIDLRREIYESDGCASSDDIERYIKNNKTLSKYHVLYGTNDASQEQCVLSYGTDIDKTCSALKQFRPSEFDIVGFDESNCEFEYSYHAESFDWSNLKDEE